VQETATAETDAASIRIVPTRAGCERGNQDDRRQAAADQGRTALGEETFTACKLR
jgi:hypothetical protein